MPTVSVVTATRNYARYLPAAIESVRAQTFADWEMIIVDDGSTDDTPEVVRPFLSDRRVRYVRTDRLGQVRARNLSLALGCGSIVAFLDADDVWLPTKLEKQLALLRDRPEVGVVFCNRILIDAAGAPLPPRPTSPPLRGRVLDKMFVQNFVCFSSAITRREVLAHVGRIDPHLDLAIDFDLWLRTAAHYAFDYVDEALVQYRTGHGNLSSRAADRIAVAFSIMQRAVRRYGDAIPQGQVAEGYASTCRTLGYVLRDAEPVTAARWYSRALRWPSGRLASLKGLAAVGRRLLSRRRTAISAENASQNR